MGCSYFRYITFPMSVYLIIPFVINLDILCLRLLNVAGFDFANLFIVMVIDSSIIL